MELSLDSQECAVRKALEGQEYEAPPQLVLKVDWSSLDLMSCPEFQQLRQWVADGAINAIGVLDRDRLQAQGLQRLVFLSECKDRGVPIITVQGPPMLEGGEGQLVELALALGKERSVLRAQQGARDGLRDRALVKGLPPNMKAPFGMRWENNRLVPDDNYSIPCEVWRMGLAGWKIRAIAAELTRRGIPTPSGKVQWSTNMVRQILKNRTYAGVVEALKTEAVEPKVRKAATYGRSGRRFRSEEERIPLHGLVERPVVSEAEYRWMQERLLENKVLAEKNTRLRSYLLKGMIHCAACGSRYSGATFSRRNKLRTYYTCGKRWKAGSDGLKCKSLSFVADELENAVFESEMQRRRGVTAGTLESLRRELGSLERQLKEEREAEARAFRLASRAGVSEDIFSQEVGLIRTRQRWIEEQMERVQAQLNDLEKYSFSPEVVAVLRQRLETRLAGATPEDRRYILEAVGAKVIAQPDRSWELELQVPRDIPAPEEVLQIVNSQPGLNYT